MRESTWLDSKCDYRQWDHLCRSYGAALQMVDTVDELLALPKPEPVVVWDESAAVSHTAFDSLKSGTYVFGKTHINRLQDRIPDAVSVRIDTPNGEPCLFGVQAATIALEMRARQWP